MNNKHAQVLRDTAVVLPQLAAERDDLQQKLASVTAERDAYRNRMDAEKLAMEMHSKGIRSDEALSDLADDLEKKASEDPYSLRVLREAVELTGPDMMKNASVGGNDHGAGLSQLEQFIHGHIG